MPRVSVVVPTYNRLDRLRRVLDALESQTYPIGDMEVVVVSDGSTDGTNEYLTAIQTPLKIVPVVQPNHGAATARNSGVERATGEIVLFLDDDVVPVRECVAEHLRAHEDGGVVVLGPMLTPAGFAMMPWVRWEQTMLMKQYAAMQAGHWQPTARQFYTGNTSLARRDVLGAGGFDETFQRAEDVELGYRLAARGLRFTFNPAAVGYHYAERSFRSWLATPYAYGRNDVIFTRDRSQGWLLPTVLREFHDRHALVQLLVRACIGRRLPSALATGVLNCVGRAADLLGYEQLVQMAYSGIFNLRYYQGVADELGGRGQFFNLQAHAATS